MCRGLWAMVKGGHWWVVITTCGQWMLAGDHSCMVGSHCSCRLCHSTGTGCPLWVVVVVVSWGLFLGSDGCFHGQSASSWSNNGACPLTCHVVGCVLTWLVMWLATYCCCGGWWL